MWSDSSGSSSLDAPHRPHSGIKAPGCGVPVGRRRAEHSAALSREAEGIAQRWLRGLRAVAGSEAASCLGRSSPGKRGQGSGEVADENEPWSRAALADFLGVPDEKQVVTNMVLAHTAQFTYAAGCEMTHVVLPFINMAAAGGNLQTYGLYRSLNGLVQTAGGLAFGRFVDVCGVKASMLTAHAATLAYYGLVASATSQHTLFLSLLPAAAMHGFQATQMAAASSAPVERRAQAFGHVSFVYGTGFIVGTALVAFLSKVAEPRSVVLTAAGFEALVLSAMAWQMRDVPADEAADAEEVGAVVPVAREVQQAFLARITELLTSPGVQTVLISKLCICAASGVMLGMAPQFALDPFGLTSAQAGLLMGYVGIAQLTAQASSGWFQEKVRQLEPVRLGILSPSALAAALSGGAVVSSFLALTAPKVAAILLVSSGGPGMFPSANLASFIFWLGPLAAFQQLAQVALTVELTTRAPKRDMGFVLGVDMSMYSLSSIVTPLAAAELARVHGFFTVPLAGAALALVSTAGCLLVAATPPPVSASRPLSDEELEPSAEEA